MPRGQKLHVRFTGCQAVEASKQEVAPALHAFVDRPCCLARVMVHVHCFFRRSAGMHLVSPNGGWTVGPTPYLCVSLPLPPPPFSHALSFCLAIPVFSLPSETGHSACRMSSVPACVCVCVCVCMCVCVCVCVCVCAHACHTSDCLQPQQGVAWTVTTAIFVVCKSHEGQS
jgi:hypothetical protein